MSGDSGTLEDGMLTLDQRLPGFRSQAADRPAFPAD